MQPTARIAHPNIPGAWVEVHKPSRRDRRRQATIESNSNRVPVTIIDATTKKPFVSEKGVVQIAWRMDFDDESAFAALAVIIDGWGGIVDADGKAVPFEPRNVIVLGDEHLDVTLDGKEPQAFSAYIGDLVEKGEVFALDPTAAAPSAS
jgi:hypothetical protein